MVEVTRAEAKGGQGGEVELSDARVVSIENSGNRAQSEEDARIEMVPRQAVVVADERVAHQRSLGHREPVGGASEVLKDVQCKLTVLLVRHRAKPHLGGGGGERERRGRKSARGGGGRRIVSHPSRVCFRAHLRCK